MSEQCVPLGRRWQDRAACKGMDPELFFPRRGDLATLPAMVCATCPVQAECLEYGLRESWGVWGGLGERARRAVIKARRQQRAKAAAA